MAQFETNMSILHHLQVAAQGGTLSGRITRDSIYHHFGDIGNLKYFFDFDPLQACQNVIVNDPMEGCMASFLEELPPAQEGGSTTLAVTATMARTTKEAP